MSQQWTVVGDGTTQSGSAYTERWYYQRRTDSGNKAVILELHMFADDHNVVSTLHAYNEPSGHTTDDLIGCDPRANAAGRGIYDSWIAAKRTDASAYAAMSAATIPDPPPLPVPANAAQTIADQQAQISRLNAELSRLKSGDSSPQSGRPAANK